MLGARTKDYTLVAGRELIAIYEAPILDRPPPYRRVFCRCCGSWVPDPETSGAWIEIPAGLLDTDPQVRPDKHIYIEHAPAWLDIPDDAPRMTRSELAAWRRGER
jgi:hypothetical protein